MRRNTVWAYRNTKISKLEWKCKWNLYIFRKRLSMEKNCSPFSTDWPLKIFVSKPTSTRSNQSVGKSKNDKWRTSIRLEIFFRSKHVARIIFPWLVEMGSDPSLWHVIWSTVNVMFTCVKILYIAYPKQPPYITSSSGLVIVPACRQRACG